MPTTASAFFDSLEQRTSYSIERIELSDARFSVIRRALRLMATELQEDGDAEAFALGMSIRGNLMELLTAPLEFATALNPIFGTLGTSFDVTNRWGTSIGAWYAEAQDCAASICLDENPMRREIVATISSLGKRPFRIYCHRSARGHFGMLLGSVEGLETAEEVFLHSVRDYRDSALFDVLIKAGPLRSRGWGCAPDSILSAPKFAVLSQVVWAGCSDEEDFGYDPAFALSRRISAANASASAIRVSWNRTVRIVPNSSPDVAAAGEEVDEFALFRELDRERTKGLRRAVMVQIDEDMGVLYPPHSEVLSLSLSGENKGMSVRTAGESLKPGMFLIQHSLDDIDLGGSHASEGYYSTIWKQRLLDRLALNEASIEQDLRNAGINLKSLRSCMHHWIRPSTTVIHAPQRRKHFEILIKQLGLNSVETIRPGLRMQWWQLAWHEVVKARGVAIQTGMEGQDLIDQTLIEMLHYANDRIIELAEGGESFEFELPEDQSLRGIVYFNKVLAVEEGFRAPDSELKVPAEMRTLEQWRF